MHQQSIITDTWDINSKLDTSQQVALKEILIKYADVFAKDPKKPKVTHLASTLLRREGPGL